MRELSRERKQKPSYEPTAPGGRVRGRVSVLALLCSVLTSDTAAALTARHETSREPLQGMRLVFRSAFFSAGTSGWHAACGTVYCVIRGSSLALVARRCVQDHHRLVLSVVLVATLVVSRRGCVAAPHVARCGTWIVRLGWLQGAFDVSFIVSSGQSCFGLGRRCGKPTARKSTRGLAVLHRPRKRNTPGRGF